MIFETYNNNNNKMPPVSFVILSNTPPILPIEYFNKKINNKWTIFDLMLPTILAYKSIIHNSKGIGVLAVLSSGRVIEMALQ